MHISGEPSLISFRHIWAAHHASPPSHTQICDDHWSECGESERNKNDVSSLHHHKPNETWWRKLAAEGLWTCLFGHVGRVNMEYVGTESTEMFLVGGVLFCLEDISCLLWRTTKPNNVHLELSNMWLWWSCDPQPHSLWCHPASLQKIKQADTTVCVCVCVTVSQH